MVGCSRGDRSAGPGQGPDFGASRRGRRVTSSNRRDAWSPRGGSERGSHDRRRGCDDPGARAAEVLFASSGRRGARAGRCGSAGRERRSAASIDRADPGSHRARPTRQPHRARRANALASTPLWTYDLPAETELVVYRVAQEALTNAGRGLSAGYTAGTGMRGMLERAALIGTSVQIRNRTSPTGCEVRLDVPLEARP